MGLIIALLVIWLVLSIVGFAVKGLLERGRRVAVVQDAIETLKAEEGQKTMAELEGIGARITSTGQVLTALGR